MATILVIDDSPSERAALADPLRQAGHTVIEAEDGNAGVTLAAERRPDLCFVDDAMPGPSGVKTIRTIANDPRTVGIPCVYVQRGDDETDRNWATQAGAAECLVRPIDAEALLSLVERLASDGAPSEAPLRVVRDQAEWEDLISRAKATLYVGFFVQGPTWRDGLTALSRLAEEVGDRLVVAAVDADRLPSVVQQLGLRGVPHYASILIGPDGAPMAAPMTIAEVRQIALSRPAT